MEILNWIGKELAEVKSSLLFGKYFDTVSLEEAGDEYYLLNPTIGIDIMLRIDYIIKTIHLYSWGHAGIKSFSDILPLKLEFGFSRKIVHDILGRPNESGGGHPSFSPFYEMVPHWDKYIFSDFYFHIGYKGNGDSINLITIGMHW